MPFVLHRADAVRQVFMSDKEQGLIAVFWGMRMRQMNLWMLEHLVRAARREGCGFLMPWDDTEV